MVWRCPGPPVHYTDRLTPAQGQAQGCTVLQDVPVAAGVRAVGVGPAASAPSAVSSRITPADQQQRDAQARRILQAELQREEQRLEALNPAQTEQIRRTRADIEALRRELSRLR